MSLGPSLGLGFVRDFKLLTAPFPVIVLDDEKSNMVTGEPWLAQRRAVWLLGIVRSVVALQRIKNG